MLGEKPLSPHHKLLFAGPHVVSNKLVDNPNFSKSPLFGEMLEEYLAIYNVLSQLVGEDLVVIENSCPNPTGEDLKKAQEHVTQKTGHIPQIKLPSMFLRYRMWPRDGFTYFNGQVYLNKQCLRTGTQFAEGSLLGEGGAVLSAETTMMPCDLVYDECFEQIYKMRRQGCEITSLPMPGIALVEEEQMGGVHIDGHNTLVQCLNHGLGLATARSYYYSAEGLERSQILHAGIIAGARAIIDDSHFPPKAFNIPQFHDGSVVMTKGAPALESQMKEWVGADKVYTTRIPIQHFPRELGGSIRCLTNIVPDDLLHQFAEVLK